MRVPHRRRHQRSTSCKWRAFQRNRSLPDPDQVTLRQYVLTIEPDINNANKLAFN